jgi:hypothetical protein
MSSRKAPSQPEMSENDNILRLIFFLSLCLFFVNVSYFLRWESECGCFCLVKYVTAASVDHSQGKKMNREFLLLMEICPGGEDD